MYRALEAGDRETAGQCLDSILALRDLFLTTPSLLNAYTHAMNLLGCEGSFAEDSVFEIDEKASAEFDKSFPHREKVSGLPSQKRFREVAAMRRPRQA